MTATETGNEQFVDRADGPPSRLLGWVVAVASVVGTVMSALLLLEKVRVLENPDHVPACSISPVLSCGSVIMTPQASVIGDLPNPVLGIAGFPMVLVAAVAMIMGSRLPKWYLWTLFGGTILGVALVQWLAWQSLYEIGALCPYCMVVWVMTMIILGGVLVALSRAGALPEAVGRWAPWAVLYWHLALVGLIGVRFWDYWQTLI